MNFPVIIPGSYRSGSSYVAGKIHDAGIDMIATDGRKHYEERCIYQMIEGEMRYHMEDEEDFQNKCFRSIPFRFEPSKFFLGNLKQYKADREKDGKPYGFKMPQLAWYMSTIADVWPEAYYVVCLRNSLCAMWSQQRRGKITLGQPDFIGVYRHMQYITNICCVAQQKNLRIHFFNYDGNIKDEAVALGEFLGVEITMDDFKWVEGKRKALPSEIRRIGEALQKIDLGKKKKSS